MTQKKSKKKEQEFKEEIKKPIEFKKEEQEAVDAEVATEIITGSQEITIGGVNIVFEWPSVGLSMEGDRLHAQFKAEHLRKGDLLSEAQLKAYYKRPVFIEIDGQEVLVGNGEWTEQDDEKMEETPTLIDDLLIDFDMHRETLHEQQLLLDELPKNSKKRAPIKKKIEEINEVAYKIYLDISTKRLEVAKLNLKRNQLFADSLEEQANLEKIRLFAPQCIKKKEEDGTLSPLWESEEDMLNSEFSSVRVISLFSLFIRGVDISFFGDTLGG